MDQNCLERSPEEVAEIEKHKYFLSEQAGYDVGWEAAEQDWESNHAARFRIDTKSDSPGRPGVATLLKRLFVRG